MRRAAGDAVAGRLQLGFDWDFNARSLLRLKLAALEGVLTQRVEVLCALAPVPAAAALAWLQLPPRPLAVRRPDPTPALAVRSAGAAVQSPQPRVRSWGAAGVHYERVRAPIARTHPSTEPHGRLLPGWPMRTGTPMS
jgi:hypothetical protein